MCCFTFVATKVVLLENQVEKYGLLKRGQYGFCKFG
jgi:hypothetical protein